MKNRMVFLILWITSVISLALLVTLVAQHRAVANQNQRSEQLDGTPTPTRTLIPAFLYPPYADRVKENAVFDHSIPNNDGTPDNDYVSVFNGRKAICQGAFSPCTYANTTPPPVVYADYNDHEGIDYDVNYGPILATANSYASALRLTPNTNIKSGPSIGGRSMEIHPCGRLR